jgi:two-component system sensor histidine kinase QseC
LDKGAQSNARAVDLVKLTRQVLIDAMPIMESRQMDLSLESAEQLNITVDDMAFHSILDNLLRNAMAYAGQSARVLVQLSVKEDKVLLSVSDDGPGIPAEERKRLFNRFQRGRHTTAHGSGLGLAIVQQAALRLGGKVSAGSGLDGRGVEFRVEWPAVVSVNSLAN